jgi:hypothetical protein
MKFLIKKKLPMRRKKIVVMYPRRMNQKLQENIEKMILII